MPPTEFRASRLHESESTIIADPKPPSMVAQNSPNDIALKPIMTSPVLPFAVADPFLQTVAGEREPDESFSINENRAYRVLAHSVRLRKDAPVSVLVTSRACVEARKNMSAKVF